MRLYSRLLKIFICLSLYVSISLSFSQANAEPMKEFVMSCSYGVLAGTLVGAATLAFTDKPGDNLNKVARGASLGLYAGILLGLYVVYGVPSGVEEEEEIITLQSVPKFKEPDLQIYPLVTDRGLEGAAMNYSVFKF